MTAVATKTNWVHYLHMPKKTLGNIEDRPRCRTFLRPIRKYRGYTQTQAGEKIGVSYTTVGRKENGANVDQTYLEAAAKAYDCEVIDFFRRPAWLTVDGAAPGLEELREAFDRLLLDATTRPQSQAPPPQEPRSPTNQEGTRGGPQSTKKPNRPRRP